MDIFSTPLEKDYVTYTDLYNKARTDTSFINSLYTIDPYGKYQFTTINSNFYKDYLSSKTNDYLKTDKRRMVIDYISLMTDEYLMKEYKSLQDKIDN